MYWATGFNNDTPQIVHIAVESWRKQNPTWSIHLLSEANEGQFVRPRILQLKKFCRTVQAWSDLLRTEVLCSFGGAWADCTLLCFAPLDTWVNEASLFTCFKKSSGRICSWFLRCPYGSPAMDALAPQILRQEAIARSTRYWWRDLAASVFVCPENERLVSQCQFVAVTHEHYVAPYSSQRLEALSKDPRKTVDVILACNVVKLTWRTKLYDQPWWMAVQDAATASGDRSAATVASSNDVSIIPVGGTGTCASRGKARWRTGVLASVPIKQSSQRKPRWRKGVLEAVSFAEHVRGSPT